MGAPTELEVLIVGAGLSGMCAAINLLDEGVDDLLLVEMNSGAGGIWRYNSYPGCACDVASPMYSFSFALNPAWSRLYSGQQEILAYVEDVFARYRLDEHTRFNTEVLSYIFDEDTDRWRVELSDGSTLHPRIVIAAIGALHKPNLPDFPGVERFGGTLVHSSRWDPSLDLRGRRVAVVGTGASSVQIVPAIAGEAEHVYVIQRTPQWVLAKADRPLKPAERRLFSVFPSAQKLYRYTAYWTHELVIIAFMRPKLLGVLKWLSLRTMRKQVPDPQLRAKLTPDYMIGCKRILLSNDYYPTLLREDVELVDSAVQCLEPDGLRTTDGRQCPVDVIVLATGFATDNRLAEERIVGRGGLTIQEAWRDGMRAHLGTTVAGFPNFFLMMGPNSGGGSQSILFVIEQQAHYIARCVRLMRSTGARRMEIREHVQDKFNDRIHRKLARSVWNSGGCDSWFLDHTGKNRQAWPGSSVAYWYHTRRPRRGWFTLRVGAEAARSTV